MNYQQKCELMIKEINNTCISKEEKQFLINDVNHNWKFLSGGKYSKQIAYTKKFKRRGKK